MITSLSLLDDEPPQEMTIKLNPDSPFLTTPEKELIGIVREGYRVISVEDFLGSRELVLVRV